MLCPHMATLVMHQVLYGWESSWEELGAHRGPGRGTENWGSTHVPRVSSGQEERKETAS